MSRSGPDGLHVPEKEATVSNILQIIRYTASLKTCFQKNLLYSNFLAFDSSLPAPSDLVIVVWRQRILMMPPPVPLLLVHPQRPEITPSGTAAAISQYPYFSFYCVGKQSINKPHEFFQFATSGTEQQELIKNVFPLMDT